MNTATTWYPAPRYLLRKLLIKKYFKNKNVTNCSMLEIGYGAGDMLKYYSSIGFNVYGYDFSESAYSTALETIRGISTIHLLKNESTISSLQYNYLSACEVLEHIKDDTSTLEHWHNLLADNGILILSVPSRMKKWCANDDWAGHIRRYEKNELKDKLSSNGFRVIHFWSYPFPANLILDKLINKGKSTLIKLQKENNMDEISATKESGIKRDTNKLYRVLSNEYFLYPAHLIQQLFLNTDLGSGYIVFAQKVS